MTRWLVVAVVVLAGMAGAVLAKAEAMPAEFDDDVRVFRRLINIDVQNAEAYDQIVGSLEENGVLSDKPEKFTRTVSKILYRNRIQAYRNLGLALQKKGYESQSQYLLEIYSRFRPAKEEAVLETQTTARNVYR